MLLQAPHCPSCGAPVDVPAGARRVACAYCGNKLVVEDRRVTTTHEESLEGAERNAQLEPEATLWTSESPHFELSVIEQIIPGAVDAELFKGVELGDGRFAFVSLRIVDKEGRPVAHPLDAAFVAVRESLEADADPGLAANLALETLASKPFDHRLECAVVLFEPRAMRVVIYAAGARDGIVWASSEEGRAIVPSIHHPPLERKMLRESGDHFSNAAPIQLAAGDLLLVPSAGFVGRGARRGDFGAMRALLDTVNGHLGEAPLRVVTLAKNAFWDARRRYEPEDAPPGDVRIAAVRAIPPPLATTLPSGVVLHTFRSRRFEIALFAGPTDLLQLLALHSDRQVLVWISFDAPPPPDAMARASAAILEILAGDTGDNENPRRAGRDALASLGATGHSAARIAVIQLFDQYERVKYFRSGFKQPIPLGPRGVRGGDLMAFDEGGEATVGIGARLFFPGSLPYERVVTTAADFAEAWRGGKTSRLYGALNDHWKTKKTDAALNKVALAARSDEPDVPSADLGGLALVTCLPT